MIGLIVALSVVAQYASAFFAVRLIKITSHLTSWVLISLSILFIAVRRTMTLYFIVSGDPSYKPDMTFELVGLLTSVLMLAGIICISPLFKSMTQNITDLTQARKELRESILTLDDVTQGITENIMLLDKDFRILWANKALLKETGLPKEKIIGRRCYKVTHMREQPCESPTDLCPVHELLEAGHPVTEEHLHYTEDGSTEFVEVTAYPIRDETGEIVRFVLVSKNVTQRRKSEQAVADERERLRVMLRSIGDGVIVTDIDGNVTLINRVGEELTGWLHEEAIGGPLTEVFNIINEITRKKCENPVQRVLTSGYIVGLANHTALIRKDGTEIIIADSAAPVRDREDKIIGVILVFRDITAQHKMEAEIQKMQKLESLALLAGGLAHDFNNLLTGIIGNVSLAKMNIDPEQEAYAYLTKAEGATQRAASVTQQLLTFAKGGAPVKRKTEIAELVKESVEFALHGSPVRCEYVVPSELWWAEVDSGQIAQVFNNLMINAIQSMPNGGTVHIGFENISLPANQVPTLPSGDYIRIEFRDEGTGIAEDHLSKIFDPYFTTKQQGSGLGLATVFSIISRHDGYIGVKSTLGKGTAFDIYLSATREISENQYLRKEFALSGQGRILIMDDEEVIRETAGAMVMSLGYEVEFSRDGTEAIELYKMAMYDNRPFNIVIMDLTIPGGMGGKEAIKKLIEIDVNAKVIVSSGYSTDPIMSDYKEYGFSGIITKPYNMVQISTAIAKVLAT